MNTLRNTKRGIEFELEIIEIHSHSIKVLATCEEGFKDFIIDFGFSPIKSDSELYSSLCDGETTPLTDDDLEEVYNWVDETTIGFIASEVSKICVSKSNVSEYWSFGIYTNETVCVDIHKMKVLQPDGFESIESFFAQGEEEIKELISKLK